MRDWWPALVDQGIVSATNFLAGVMIGRSCSKDEFGLYMLGFSIVLLVTDLQVSLVSTPYMVYSPRVKGRRLRLYAGSSLLQQFALSGLAMIALAAGGALLSLGLGPSGLARVVWTLFAVISFIMLKEFVRRVCFADLRAGVALSFDICVGVLQSAGLLLLYHLGMLSAHNAYWIIGCACSLVGLGWLVLNRTAFELRSRRARSDFGHNWESGKWIFPGSVLWTISMNLYPWLLTSFYGTASAGAWAACLGVVALANVPFIGMQNYLGPRLANAYAKGGVVALRRMVFTSTLILFSVTGVLCCALVVMGDPLLVALYGSKYRGNGLVVSVLGLGLVASAAAFSFSRALLAVNRADVDFKTNFIPLFVLIGLGLWLVQALGLLGAAVGLLVAHVAASCMRGVSFSILTRPSGRPAS